MKEPETPLVKNQAVAKATYGGRKIENYHGRRQINKNQKWVSIKLNADFKFS